MMDLQRARIGLLVPDPTPVWSGSALGEQSASFVLTVSTTSGALSSEMAGMVLVREGKDLVRIKSVVSLTLTLAENAAPFASGDSLVIFALRLPFPRYQRLDGTTVYKDWDVPFPATWQHTLPPTAVVTPECAWLRLGETLTFDAQASRAMSAGATTGVTAGWDAGSWGSTNVYGTENGVTGRTSFVEVSDLGVWAYSIGNLLTAPDFGIAGINKTGGGGSGRIFTGVVGSDSWQYSDNLGGLLPTAYYDAHNNRVYTIISGWEMRRLAGDLYTIETPLALSGEVGVLGGFSRGFPAFYAWNTDLHATVGVYGTDYENSIQWSDDAWETFSASGDVGRVIEMLVGIPTHPGNLILGRYSAPSSGQYHVIYANDDLGATMPVERAGADPNDTATTVSIPYDCGGIAYNGILLPPDYCEV